MTRREECSIIKAIHQQKGQPCGKANGNHAHQKPSRIGTVVKSTCQTWLGRFAVTTRPDAVGASGRRVLDFGFSFRMRPIVVAHRRSPARASTSASFFLPRMGHSVLI